MTAWNLALSLDQLLTLWVAQYGLWAVGIVACVIFAETGLVIAPFLPGDSLLFLAGAVFSASGLHIHGAAAVLLLAAVLGDTLNFAIGWRAGPWVTRRFGGRWLRQDHLDATHRYFERFGGATIVIARFIPVVRTVAPFVAGAGHMHYARFAFFNVVGAIAWVTSFFYAGVLLGSQPAVRSHIGLISLTVVVLSAVPVAWAWWRSRRQPASAT